MIESVAAPCMSARMIGGELDGLGETLDSFIVPVQIEKGEALTCPGGRAGFDRVCLLIAFQCFVVSFEPPEAIALGDPGWDCGGIQLEGGGGRPQGFCKLVKLILALRQI